MGNSRDEYFDQLEKLFDKWYTVATVKEEESIKERILSISYDKVVELENKIQELEKIGPKRVIESAKQDPLI